MTTTQDRIQLDEIISHLVPAYNPLAIYLFGSYAWGNPGSSSDIDLMVIVEQSDLSAAERIRVGLTSLKEIHADVDLVVFTQSEFTEKKGHPSTLVYKVVHDGVKLYEAA
jgi:predicted nucleotidyltransferase